jgi:hypothetical protein
VEVSSTHGEPGSRRLIRGITTCSFVSDTTF